PSCGPSSWRGLACPPLRPPVPPSCRAALSCSFDGRCAGEPGGLRPPPPVHNPPEHAPVVTLAALPTPRRDLVFVPRSGRARPDLDANTRSRRATGQGHQISGGGSRTAVGGGMGEWAP